MRKWAEHWRFWTPVVLLFCFAMYCMAMLVFAHVCPPEVRYPDFKSPKYDFTTPVPALRGSIYSSYGKSYPLVKSVPYWEYRLDPVALTNAVVKPKKEKKKRTPEAILKTIADVLGLDYKKLKKMAANTHNRYQFLKLSADPKVYDILSDSSLVAGLAIDESQVRQYIHGNSLSHVLGYANSSSNGLLGVELRFNRELTGTPGLIQGMKDVNGRELYDKRTTSISPKRGSDVYLTIDPNIQFETEDALKWGLAEFGASSAWCIVMDTRTGAVLAMVTLPDFDPLRVARTPKDVWINRAIGFNYEPGSVMKVLTAASAIDAGMVSPHTVYMTDRFNSKYYNLPSDGGHDWVYHPRPMTVKEAIVHSSNIVIGKLAYDFGPKRLWAYMKRFGLGQRTGIELPGEQYGILPDPNKKMWDKASWSRAGIGQFVAVTAIQMIGVYQTIANDGMRMKPYIVDRIVEESGMELYRHEPESLGRPISAKTARTMREVMLDVASPRGTARRAAIRGYSVAGKTGTAQKQIPGGKGYYQGLYRASFCGIVPATEPRFVVLVTLDFEQKTKFHQGGNSAGPVFRRIASYALRYLGVQSDRPDELAEFNDDDDYDRVMDERARKYGAISED